MSRSRRLLLGFADGVGYDYNNQYQTTTYGAQGGARGGGFVNQDGSQGNSQASPGSNQKVGVQGEPDEAPLMPRHRHMARTRCGPSRSGSCWRRSSRTRTPSSRSTAPR